MSKRETKQLLEERGIKVTLEHLTDLVAAYHRLETETKTLKLSGIPRRFTRLVKREARMNSRRARALVSDLTSLGVAPLAISDAVREGMKRSRA